MSKTMESIPLNSQTASSSLPDLMALNTFDDCSAQLRSSYGSTCMSVAFSEPGTIASFEEPEDLLGPDSNTIPVSISGTDFSVEKRIFEQLKKLPWTKEAGVFSLHASPDLFEIILNYLLFKTLPDAKAMSPHDKEELEVMSVLLDLTELAGHVMTKASFRQRRGRTSSTSSVKSDKSKENKAPDNNNQKEKDSKPTLVLVQKAIPKTLSKDTTDPASSDDSSAGSDEGVAELAKDEERQTAPPPPPSKDGNHKKESSSPKSSSGQKMKNGFCNSIKRAFGRGSISGKTDKPKSSSSCAVVKSGSTQRRLTHEELCQSYSDIVN